MTGTWPLSWATGDLMQAAEFKKGIGAIFDSTLVGSAANVDVTSISGTYAHLLVVVYARGDTAATSAFLNVRFNGDTAANYDVQMLNAVAATPLAGEVFAATATRCGVISANTAGANLFSASVAFIPNYASSANNKLVLSMASLKYGTSTGNMVNYLHGGFWRSNAAINQVTLLPGSGNFVAGTRVSVYGMGA